MYDWFFNCQKYSEKFSRSMDAPTPWLHKFFMWLRCLICKDSRNYSQQLNIIREATRANELPPDHKNADMRLPEDCIRRMKSAIKSECAKSN